MNKATPEGAIHVTSERGSLDLAALKEVLSDCISKSFPAGLSIAVVDREGPLFSAYGGQACYIGSRQPITATTSYDLASVTKMVCSVSLAVIFARRKSLSLDDPVQRWLPRYPRRDTSLMHLVTHTSGLVDETFFEYLRGRPAFEEAIFDATAEYPPTGEVSYADINFILLGWVLEACGEAGLDALFAKEVATPLAMTRTVFCPGPNEETAATELDGDQRGSPGLVWGEVHDGNANALGGVAGHAGLFAPLRDLVNFTRHLLDPDGRVLTVSDLEEIETRRAGQSPDIRGIGWRLAPEAWGDWPEDTLWHTGFTGTSLLVARSLGLGVVLLTNAIHPYRHIDEQAEMRAVIHRIVSEAFR